MADPRGTVTFNEVGDYDAYTFVIDNSTIVYDGAKKGGSAGVGLAVSLSASKTVQLVADGDAITGKLIEVFSDNVATVKVGDVLILPGGTGATLTPGSAIVGALGAASARGYIRSAASGTAAELVKCRGSILDNTDTTAVAVHFS